MLADGAGGGEERPREAGRRGGGEVWDEKVGRGEEVAADVTVGGDMVGYVPALTGPNEEDEEAMALTATAMGVRVNGDEQRGESREG